MKAKDIRELSPQELEAKQADLSQEIFNLKFQLHTGQQENAGKIKFVKRDLARIKTILHEQQIKSAGDRG